MNMKISEVVARELMSGSATRRFTIREDGKLYVKFDSFKLTFLPESIVVTYYNGDTELHVETYNVHPLEDDTVTLKFEGRIAVEME